MPHAEDKYDNVSFDKGHEDVPAPVRVDLEKDGVRRTPLHGQSGNLAGRPKL